MKAITLHQPWATLIAKGYKTVETRGYSPPRKLIGERIAIHAGKTVASRIGNYEAWLPLDREMSDELIAFGVPRSAVVCTAILNGAGKVVDIEGDGATAVVETRPDEGTYVAIDRYGDFSVGRWLWFLSDVQVVDPPVPARGHQGFWEWQETEV